MGALIVMATGSWIAPMIARMKQVLRYTKDALTRIMTGIRNPDDLCPNTAGPASNDGCPIIEKEDKETLEFAMQAVQFEHGSARLTPGSFGVLNQVVEIMKQVTADYRLEISGHTDNTGAGDFNQRLSERRARHVFSIT